MTNTLITWACGHFCIRQSTSYESGKQVMEGATDDFWFLVDTADEDLSNVATDRHISSRKHCPKCQEPTGVGLWRLRAIESICVLRHLNDGSKLMYLETGAQYWKLDFSQKAKYTHHPECAPAHDQFWVSKTPRHQDPFFAPMEGVRRLCDQADPLVKAGKTHEDVKQAFVHINNARALIGSIIAPLGDLLSGIELMSEAKSRHKENAVGHDGLMSREAMVSIPKAMSWLHRMEDWEDEAMAATQEALSTR